MENQVIFKLRQRNRLRMSCAPAVGRGDFKKRNLEDGAVQPITYRSLNVAAEIDLALIPNISELNEKVLDI
jgi:hypothetical protein